MGMGVGRAIDPPLSPSFVRSQERCGLDAPDSLTLSAATIDKDSFDARFTAAACDRMTPLFYVRRLEPMAACHQSRPSKGDPNPIEVRSLDNCSGIPSKPVQRY
jgi:hypothetical protein